MSRTLEELPRFGSQDEFDRAHRLWRDRLMEFYSLHGVVMTHGQAQKWINMTAKYLLVLNDPQVSHIAHCLHVPLDRVVAEQAKADLGVKPPRRRWSKLDAGEYEDYQRHIREAIQTELVGLNPIQWEISAWTRGMSH